MPQEASNVYTLTSKMASRTDPLIELLRGRLSWRDLPEEITLPESLWRQMDELWQRSIAHIAEGQVSEWGGVLVLGEQDNLELTGIAEGTDRGIALRLTSEQAFVGSFHTHPYPDGTTGIAFSGSDIADAVNSGELISLVQSGEEVFTLIRTDMTIPHLDRSSAKTWYEVLRYDYLVQGMSEQDAARYVNIDFCMACSMAFYTGVTFGPLVEEYRP